MDARSIMPRRGHRLTATTVLVGSTGFIITAIGSASAACGSSFSADANSAAADSGSSGSTANGSAGDAAGGVGGGAAGSGAAASTGGGGTVSTGGGGTTSTGGGGAGGATAVCGIGDRRCEGSDALLCNEQRSGWVAEKCATTCINGFCDGPTCRPGSTQCKLGLQQQQVCTADGGNWRDLRACGADEYCLGDQGCTVASNMALPVPPGSFTEGPNSYPGQEDGISRQVKLAGFKLDKYEVSVARFRAFVEAYPENGAYVPKSSRWAAGWTPTLPQSRPALRAALLCNPEFQTWTEEPASHEGLAINCVDWFVAFAFCDWDGGRLPTEAEWEYAAKGGGDNRVFPWGPAAPERSLANFICPDCASTPFLALGSKPAGVGRWGHLDLAGGVWEWTLDWHATLGAAAVENPAKTDSGSARVVRGGSWNDDRTYLPTTLRNAFTPTDLRPTVGIRCAR